MIMLSNKNYSKLSVHQASLAINHPPSVKLGFTIVELLIVIVVIGILAAITVVSYTGIQTNAAAAALKSDLTQAKTKLDLYKVTNSDQYPATEQDTKDVLGLDPDTKVEYTPTPDHTSYCITLSSNQAKTAFHIDGTTGAIADGACSGHVGYVAGGGPSVNGGVVTTLAGSTSGFADGTGAGARFNAPYGVAVDSSGNVYVADSSNNRIRKVTPGGVVTTLAGSTSYGFVDGTGTSARFYYTSGITVDGSGTVYVADSNNQRIRKITSSGVVTTLAGSDTYGFADGTGTSAQFADPVGIAVDSSGNIYVADEGNNRIRKIQ